VSSANSASPKHASLDTTSESLSEGAAFKHRPDANMVDNMTDTTRPEISDEETPLPLPSDLARPTSLEQATVGAWAWPSLETVITFVLVAGATLFLLRSLEPSHWFSSTTPTGGDMGAHVWSPAYLRDVLLPNFRLTGWSPDWYAGFPAFTFYMIVPSLLIVVVNIGLVGWLAIPASIVIATGVLWMRPRFGTSSMRIAAIHATAFCVWMLVVPVEYGIAMKLVVVAGMLFMPIAAWSAGKLAGLAFPGPAVLAVMTLPFLFDRSYNIYGGNLMSTMAGEFAYSLGLTIAVVYLGVVARGIETGKGRGLAAVLLALAGLTHLFAAFFAIVATLALLLTRPSIRTLVWTTVMGSLAGLLAAFWVLPFFWNRALLNDMGWGKERRYVPALWNRSGSFGDQDFLVNDPPLQLFVILAVIGAVVFAIRRIRFGMALSMTAMVFALAFVLLPEGRLWNVRIVPFYYLAVYLSAGLAMAEIGRWVAQGWSTSGELARRGRTLLAAGPVVVGSVVLIVFMALPLRQLPFGGLNDAGEYGWPGLRTTEQNLGPGWLRHNFNGYEGASGWTEYAYFVATMGEVGSEFGCGRSLWEYGTDRLGSYGTPMAPMLLPYWTDGCIGSMEGLYFEASATTPYHFLLQSELSAHPSRAQRDLPYSDLDALRGVGHLQDLGVRYYMAFSEEAVAQGRAVPELTEIATAGAWVIFLVGDSGLVVPLDHQPVVMDGLDAGGEEWLIPTVAWWEADDVPLVAADGPSDWPRTSVTEMEEAWPGLNGLGEVSRVSLMNELAAAYPSLLDRVDVDPVDVSNVEVDEFSISFEVDRVGSPVLVRSSYFPNWSVSGGEGPYRVAPNLMVVVPTDTHVELNYGRSGIELFSILLSIIGLTGLLFHRRFRIGSEVGLWDLGAARAEMNDADQLIDAVSAGHKGWAEINDLGLRIDVLQRRVRWMTSGAVIALLVTVIGRVILAPGADDMLLALGVYLPGIFGASVLIFWGFPAIIDTAKARRSARVAGRIAGGVRPVETADGATR
jgi:hypothetical protein